MTNIPKCGLNVITLIHLSVFSRCLHPKRDIKDNAMPKTGIDRIKISVRDLAESVAFFQDTMEMTVAAEVELDAAAMQRLWDLPEGTKAKAAFLKNDQQPTVLELIQFNPNSGQFIRDGANVFDLGLFDVAFRAQNIDAIYEDFKARGIEFISPPVVYTADWANVTVKEVIFIGPNRMPIALIERLTEPKPVIKNRFGTIVDAAQFVADVPETAAFYTDILGYTSVFDRDLPDGLIDGVLDLPDGTHSRMAFLLKVDCDPPAITPAVELIRTSAPAKSLAPVIKPTNIGLFGLGFEVEDLDDLAEKCIAGGYRMLGGPLEMETTLHGTVKTMVLEGPNQALLEFYQA